MENHVEKRKEEKWSNDFRGEGHIEDGRTELNVLESCFHADGAPAPVWWGNVLNRRQLAAAVPPLPLSDTLGLQHPAQDSGRKQEAEVHTGLEKVNLTPHQSNAEKDGD